MHEAEALKLINGLGRDQLGNLAKLLRCVDSRSTAERLAALVQSQVQFAPDTPAVAAPRAAGGDEYDFILATMCDVCREAGLDVRGIGQAKTMRAYAAFRRSIVDVHKAVKGYAPGRGVQRQLYRLAFRHIQAQHRCGLKQLMSRTSTVLLALDEMFPGYYRAGLMPLVIGRLTENKK